MKMRNAFVISIGLFLIGSLAWAAPTLVDTITFNSNTTAVVSPAGKGALRYNNVAGQFQQSSNGAAWASLGGPPFSDATFAVVDAVDPTKQFKIDVQGNAATVTTLRTNQTVNRTQDLADFDGDYPICQSATRQMFINQTAADNGSGAGIQYRSDVSSRAQLRTSQYGAAAGVPGLSTFKSRGLLGVLAPVIVGDVIGRLTAVGVTGNNAIPLSGLASFNVTAVPPASGWVGTEWEIQDVSNLGPANGRRVVHKIDSEGVPWLREDRYPASLGNSAMGVVTTGAGGIAIVVNTNIKANTRIALTVQDGGAAPTNGLYVSARVVGVNFTIQMIGADANVNVLYQLTQVAP